MANLLQLVCKMHVALKKRRIKAGRDRKLFGPERFHLILILYICNKLTYNNNQLI